MLLFLVVCKIVNFSQTGQALVPNSKFRFAQVINVVEFKPNILLDKRPISVNINKKEKKLKTTEKRKMKKEEEQDEQGEEDEKEEEE